jgi:pSer/pThr/pTyr-binding forkhead associated (FHA) protein
MPRMIVSIDGVVIKDVQLSKEHTTVGRRPYNDIVIDNLAVSGEHAVLHMTADQEVEIEDLGSTNGTYVNAKAVRRQVLHSGDTIEVGKYKIRYQNEVAGENYEKTMVFKPSMLPAAGSMSRPAPMNSMPTPLQASTAIIRVMSGAAAGREVALQKVVTTVGKPGLAVVSITKRHQGFVLAHVEGAEMPLLNGQTISSAQVHLKDGDRLELAGTMMQFEQR